MQHSVTYFFDIHISVHRNIITNYSQQDAAFLEFIFTDALQVSGWFLRPSSGAHNCTYSFRYCQQPILLLAAVLVVDNTWDDGQRNLLKHVERL